MSINKEIYLSINILLYSKFFGILKCSENYLSIVPFLFYPLLSFTTLPNFFFNGSFDYILMRLNIN
jgi:hypothetical protein